MKTRWVNVIWGIVLVLAGGLFLTQNLGWIEVQSLLFWTLVFGGVSLLFFITYFVNGRQSWGWLFPAFIFAGVAVTILLAETGVDEAWVGAPVLIGVSLPFLAVYLVDRKENWWALIPMWATAVIAAILFIVDRVEGEWIGTIVMMGIGLPFLVVYITDRSRWWALIPGGILVVFGFIPALTTVANDNLIGALVMFIIALPFFIVYFARSQNWWAMIPAGVLASFGLVILLSTGDFEPETAGWLNGLLFLGIGLTFGLLWLRRGSVPTAWARYPALILILLGLVVVVLGEGYQEFIWPAAIILLGAWILYSNLKKPAEVEAPPLEASLTPEEKGEVDSIVKELEEAGTMDDEVEEREE